MKTFVYEAIREPGQKVTGEVDAEELSAAATALVARGYHVLHLEDADASSGSDPSLRFGLFTGFKRRDLVRFSRDLSSLLRAGLPLVQSLGKLRARESRKGWRGVFAGIQAALEDGATFSQSLSQLPQLFDAMYINLIRAGEEGGTLADTLQRLADVSEHRDELRSKVSLALVYPLIMLGVGTATVAILLTLVVPMFTQVFQEMNQTLPLPTRMLVNASSVMKAWWWLILPVAALVAMGVLRFAKTPTGARIRDALVLRLPRLGKAVSMAEIGAFARTLGMLLSNGVAVVRALEVTAATLRNHYFRVEVERVQQLVRDGEALSRSLSETERFPDSLSSILAVGEESGTLADTLIQVADDCDRDLERELKILATLLEPAMIIVVGAVVGFIVAAIVLPIFDLGDLAQV